MATVTFTPDAWDQTLKLPTPIRTRLLLKLVDRLEGWPDVSGAKPLRASLPAITAFAPAIIACNSGSRGRK